MWCIFSTSLPSLDGAIAIVHTPYNPWCFTDLWRYTEAAGYASHSHETIFATSFKTAFLEQLLLGKARHKSKCKLIHTAIILNIAHPLPLFIEVPIQSQESGWSWQYLCVRGIDIASELFRRVIFVLFFILSQIFQTGIKITQINDLLFSSCVPRKLLMSLMDAIFFITNQKNLKFFVPYLKDQFVPIITYTYTTHITAKMFNYK